MEANSPSCDIDLLSNKISKLLLSSPGPEEGFPRYLRYFQIQKQINYRLQQLNTWRFELMIKYPIILNEIDQLIESYSYLKSLKVFNPGSIELIKNISNTMLCLKRPIFPFTNYEIIEHPRFLTNVNIIPILANIYSIYIDSFNSVITDIKLLKDNSTIILASFDHTIRLWNIVNGKQLKILVGHKGYLEKLEITNDEKYLLSASHDKYVFIWDLKYYQKVQELKWHEKTVFDVILTNDQQFVVSGDEGGSIFVGCWQKFVENINRSGTTQVELYCRFEHGFKVRRLLSSKDGKSIFSAGLGNCIKIWDLQTKELKSILSGHSFIIYDLKILSQRNYLISTGQDCCVILWDLERMCMLNNIRTAHHEYINSICINQDETYAILAGKSMFYSILDITNRCILEKVDIERGFINAITLRNNEEIIFCEDNVTGFNMRTKAKTFYIGGNFWSKLIYHNSHLYDKYVMGYFKDRTVKFWQLENGEISFTFNLPDDALSVSYTSNYKYLLYSKDLKTLLVLKISFNSE